MAEPNFIETAAPVLGDIGPGPALSGAKDDIPWDELHQLVQAGLSPLADDLPRRNLRFRARAGKSASDRFLLSYWAFDVPDDHGIDPVIVGVLFDKRPSGEVLVQADVSGEESGKVYHDEGDVVVPAGGRDELLRLASRLASRLAGCGDAVVVGLQQPGDEAGG